MTDLYTLGHSSHTLDEFRALLAAAGVRLVADVRRFPSSTRFPWFSAKPLARDLAQAGIGYEHFPDLGGYRDAATDTAAGAGLPALWQSYAAHMQTAQFAAALDRLVTRAQHDGPVAVMCAEREPDRCHRHLLADAVEVTGTRVIHLLGPAAQRRHVRHPRCVVEDGRVSYPDPCPTLF